MDSDLPGSEMPGAILDYVKESKEEQKIENKEIDLKEIKKEIFNTDIFADRYKSGINIARNDINRDEIDIALAYDKEFFQKFYRDIVLSMPSNVQKWLLKLYTEGKGQYIGPVIGVEAKELKERKRGIEKRLREIENEIKELEEKWKRLKSNKEK